jgi:alkanesulfonate monooxygenase SsuD/methylene tetrahydromethanopterin reductase-like flavin-dependent oxidoreductase (luciferase family)
MTSLGVVFLPQLPPERLRGIAVAADQSGLDELWLWEDCFLESGIATAAAALAWTERLKVGVGLLPVPLRNVALTAMEIATLERLFPGRVQIAVGHGVQEWMGQVGARVPSPLTLLREYLDALRALLRGEEVTVRGQYVQLDRVKLDWPPLNAPAIFAGAVGPKSLKLCAEAADGVVFSGGTPAAQLGQYSSPAKVVYLHAATGPGAEARLESERVRWGYDTLEGRAVSGDAAAIAAAIRPWIEMGATTVVLQPTPDDPDPESFARFVATEVRVAVQRFGT